MLESKALINPQLLHSACQIYTFLSNVSIKCEMGEKSCIKHFQCSEQKICFPHTLSQKSLLQQLLHISFYIPDFPAQVLCVGTFQILIFFQQHIDRKVIKRNIQNPPCVNSFIFSISQQSEIWLYLILRHLFANTEVVIQMARSSSACLNMQFQKTYSRQKIDF